MAHTITIDDNGGKQKNHYKIIFSGDTKPEKTERHQASINANDTVYRNGDGNWTVQAQANGGRDSWRYTGERIRHVLEFPDRMTFQINDGGWDRASAFDVIQRSDWPSESKSSSSSESKAQPTPKHEPSPTPDPNSRGPHANIRGTDRSDWQTVQVRSDDDLHALVDEHGEETVFELWDDQPLTQGVDGRDLDNVAFVGKGTEQSTLDLRGRIDTVFQFGTSDAPASGIHVRNLDVDVTDATLSTAIVQGFVRDRGAYVKDLVVRGEICGQGDGIVCRTIDDAVFEAERFIAPAGARREDAVDSSDDSVGVIMTGRSDGVLRLHDCEIGGFPNNGVYASGPRKHGNEGRAVITDHTGYDSDRDQLRVGNDSLIVNPELYADEQKAGFDNLRGIWFRYARGARVVGGSIKTHDSDVGEAIRVDSTAGEVTVEDVDIECRSSDHRARAITAYPPSSAAGGATAVTVGGARIHGDGEPRDVILIQRGRPDSTVRDTTIDVDGCGEEVDHR